MLFQSSLYTFIQLFTIKLMMLVGQIENDLEHGFVKTRPFHNEFFRQKLLDNPPMFISLSTLGPFLLLY